MSRKRNRNLPANVEDDNVYDEIDRFHLEKDDKLLNIISHKSKCKKKEVLSVRVDQDDIDYEDQDILAKKSEISETTNNWGKKRSNFYGTSYVDKDFGGVNDSDEDELLDLEEKDAIERQKRQDSTLAYANFDNFHYGGDDDYFDDDCLNFQVSRPEEPSSVESVVKSKTEKSSAKKTVEPRSKKARPLEDDKLTFVIEDPKSGDKRAITKEIMQNKGLTAKRRKDSKHARIKNRKLYDRAIIRRRSQIPDVRREITKYDGEKRGIHASTIRSVKLR